MYIYNFDRIISTAQDISDFKAKTDEADKLIEFVFTHRPPNTTDYFTVAFTSIVGQTERQFNDIFYNNEEAIYDYRDEATDRGNFGNIGLDLGDSGRTASVTFATGVPEKYIDNIKQWIDHLRGYGMKLGDPMGPIIIRRDRRGSRIVRND